MARNPYALTFSRRMALAWRIATSRMAIDATLRDFLGEDSQGKSTSRAGWASTYDATKDRPWFQRHENPTDALAAWCASPPGGPGQVLARQRRVNKPVRAPGPGGARAAAAPWWVCSTDPGDGRVERNAA